MGLPMQLTILRILLAPVFYWLFAVAEPHEYSWALIVFFIGSLTDWYDGYFARLWKMTSPLGAFLDPLADKILTGAAFIAFASIGIVPLWCVWIVIARDVLMTFFRLLSDSLNMSVQTSNFGKVKTFIQMFFIAYVLVAHMLHSGSLGEQAADLGASLDDSGIYYYGMIFVTILTVATKAQYIYDNMQVLRAAWKKYVSHSSTQKL
ncbi:MAG TPA: CDP-diacylglycerol--glycerol-3-phosphate 3-phosphatidyltransferase [Candidatus Kapabacteria bacterium]